MQGPKTLATWDIGKNVALSPKVILHLLFLEHTFSRSGWKEMHKST
ncbi:Uncharacterised protein [Serratia quinivorans]|nr:Uncharacterised protein [Serratia quinivorans]CAI2076456.1 Uncharacterised protein [Serratia quinivorans]